LTSRVTAILVAIALCAPGCVLAGQAGEGLTATPVQSAIAPPEAAPSIWAVVREMPRDLWSFVSVDSAIVLGIGGGATLLAHVWDDDLAATVEASPALNNALEPGSKYGAFALMLGGSFATYGIGRMSGHAQLAVVGADLVRGQVVSQLWVQALKFTVRRERPDGTNDLSFPSGHAAGGFAAAAVIARHYGWKGAIPAYIGAAYIGAARVHDNKHYLSDVTFGAAMGIAGARTVMLKAGRYGVRVAPALTRDAVVVGVTLVPVGKL
jgi:membrane-associated phospholipid phosphatase